LDNVNAELVKPTTKTIKDPGFLSRLFIFWINPLIKKGLKTNLKEEDICPLPSDEHFERFSDSFDNFLKKDTGSPFLFLKAFLYLNKNNLILALLLGVISFAISIGQPILLRNTIAYFEGPATGRGTIISLCASLFFISLIGAITSQQSIHFLFKIARKTQGILSYSLIKKLMSFKTDVNKVNSGNIVNLLTTDIDNFVNGGIININFVWSLPLKIIVFLGLLYYYIGISSLLGATVIAALMPLSNYYAKKLSLQRGELQNISDGRIKLTRGIINVIKEIKILALEKTYCSKLAACRERELQKLKEMAKVFSLWFMLNNSVIIIASFISFAAYLTFHSKLDLADILGAITLFGMLSSAANSLPTVMRGIADSIVSCNRLQAFTLSNKKSTEIEQIPFIKELPAIEVINASFINHESTSACTFKIGPIDLQVKQGELVVIVGETGSGKSCLLNAIQGGMNKTSGEIKICGDLAYMPQKTWLINASIKENILLGRTDNDFLFNRILAICQLEHDFDLANGELSQAGEYGSALSGGQKQRICLARTLYQNADIYILDDFLSAVDKNTAQLIKEACIFGSINDKARIIVCSDKDIIEKADKVLFIKEGQILLQGKHKELLEKDPQYKNFISDHEIQAEVPRTESSTEQVSITPKNTIYNEKVSESVENQSFFKEVLFYLNINAHYSTLIFFTLFMLREIFRVGSDYWLISWSKMALPGNTFLLIYFIFSCLAVIALYLCSLFTYQHGLVVSRSLHERLISSLMKSKLAFFKFIGHGKIYQRISKDINNIDINIPKLLLDTIFNLFILASVVITLLLANYLTAFLILAISWFYYRVQKSYLASSKEIRKIEPQLQSSLLSCTLEIQEGATIIQNLKLHSYFSKRASKKLYYYLSSVYTWLSLNRWLALRLELLSVFVLGIIISFGILFYGKINSQLFGLALTYSLLVANSLRLSVRLAAQLENSMQSIHRINAYAKQIPHEESEGKQLPKGWIKEGSIQIDSLTIYYPNASSPVLNNISLKISGGQKIGIIGRTGAGKSTLLAALMRLTSYQKGEIFIDNTNIAELSLDTLRSNITYITQEPSILPGTIRFNLDPNNRFSDLALQKVLEMVKLDAIVARLPNKLDFDLSNREAFSVGQKQLLCLARALLDQSKIILLDEATASLDNQTDALIQFLIDKEFKNSTVITIAHRIHNLVNYDKIYQINGSKLQEAKLR
jgi:ABC-type multidrug transport system fused ATPase/permease subunit